MPHRAHPKRRHQSKKKKLRKRRCAINREKKRFAQRREGLGKKKEEVGDQAFKRRGIEGKAKYHRENVHALPRRWLNRIVRGTDFLKLGKKCSRGKKDIRYGKR